jgi:hypothetical protein
MRRSTVSALLLGWCASSSPADEPKPAVRPISEADSILAVYRDLGSRARGGPAVIFVAWPDGRLVWSGDRLNGGAPYRTGRVEPEKVAALLARFEKDGLFADEKLNDAHFGPDSQYTTVLIKSGKHQVKMQSWHELFEESDKHVVDHRGVTSLDGRRRLDVLRKEPGDYLFFRFVWSETRGKLTDLIPGESTPSDGKPVMEAGVLTWQEPAIPPKPKGGGGPAGK